MHACSRLFGALLARGELFVGQLPSEEMVMAGECPGEPGFWQGWRQTLLAWVEPNQNSTTGYAGWWDQQILLEGRGL